MATFAGGTNVAEFVRGTDPVPTQAAQGAPTVAYLRGSDRGGGVGGLLYSLRPTDGGTPAARSCNVFNGRGDVVAQLDTTGTITYSTTYQADGRRVAGTTTGVNKDRQRANTKEEDPTGLLNEGMRYRDLETGVFLTRDPAGFVDGPNLYAYVKQNPWSSFDAIGLKPEEIKAIGSVYALVNPTLKKWYVGETEREVLERWEDSDHPAKDLMSKKDTVGFSRTIVESDVATNLSPKARRMVVEREMQDLLSKQYPDYEMIGKQRLRDDKYLQAKATTDPRLKAGERPVEYESKSFFFSKSKMQALGKAKSGIPRALKFNGALALLGMGIMYANSSAEASEIMEATDKWKSAVADKNQEEASIYEAVLVPKLSGHEAGPVANATMDALITIRDQAINKK